VHFFISSLLPQSTALTQTLIAITSYSIQVSETGLSSVAVGCIPVVQEEPITAPFVAKSELTQVNGVGAQLPTDREVRLFVLLRVLRLRVLGLRVLGLRVLGL
jgi:hypothetical protein